MSRRVRTSFIPSLLALAVLGGCDGEGDKDPALTKSSEDGEIPNVPVPPESGPKLGAIAEVVPVLERPAQTGRQLGYLHAGSLVARAEEPYSKEGCPGGWYPIRPRGFVCAGEAATTDLAHPTLKAMALAPKLDQPLPYTYASVQKETPLFEREAERDNAVKEVGKLRRQSALAIVGSWSALDPEGRMQRLALTTTGKFVRVADLEPSKGSEFQGVELSAKMDLPLAFIVKRGIRYWDVEKGDAERLGKADYHSIIPLTGRFRTVGPLKYWATPDNKYIRHRDATVIRQRNVWPSFAEGDQKWIDVSLVTGTLVLYEGRKAVFVTLASVGRDRLGDPATSASTAQGTFDVLGKHITAAKLDPKTVEDYFDPHDVPWAVELSSGQLLHGATWHNRFGIENGLGSVQLSPSDARRVWSWVEPEVPSQWHGVTQPAERKTIVHVRK